MDAFPSVADLVINSHIAMVWYDSLEVLSVMVWYDSLEVLSVMVWYDSLEVLSVYLRFSSTGV